MLQASFIPNKNFGEQDLKRIFSNRNYNNSMSPIYFKYFDRIDRQLSVRTNN